MPKKPATQTIGRVAALLVIAVVSVIVMPRMSEGGDDGTVALAANPSRDEQNVAAPKSREFDFTYVVKVTGLEPGTAVRIWLPVPPSNEDQQARIIRQELPGDAESAIGTEAQYGNKILYVAAKAWPNGTIPLSVTYRVKRLEVKADTKSEKVAREEMEKFLKPDAKVPIGGKPLALLAGKDLPHNQLQLGRLLYDVVNDHMTYSKEGTGWGQGDTLWACDSRYGNCSDFHSLFISLARSNQMPAKFEMGFPLPPQRGRGEISGYHCWAKFKPEGRGWIPVDISEANKVKAKDPKMVEYYFGNLTEDRVTFTVGRDLVLVPKQDGPPLNFFIYPYVEVGGKPHPAEKVERKFAFEDAVSAVK
jgi:transglutaminase-like putative cysteine protease